MYIDCSRADIATNHTDDSDISEERAPKRAQSSTGAASRRSAAGRLGTSGDSSDAGAALMLALFAIGLGPSLASTRTPAPDELSNVAAGSHQTTC